MRSLIRTSADFKNVRQHQSNSGNDDKSSVQNSPYDMSGTEFPTNTLRTEPHYALHNEA